MIDILYHVNPDRGLCTSYHSRSDAKNGIDFNPICTGGGGGGAEIATISSFVLGNI